MTVHGRGRLIVFEGVEGAGKSTQLERLAAHLSRAGIGHCAFREPGGTALGNEIRTLLLDPARAISARAEALLFMASRAELVSLELRPALERGMVVLLDRFFLSTYAYQVAGRGLAECEVLAANAMATGGLVPDLTVLLSLGADVGLARAERRSGPDRMERSGREFHARVEAAFEGFAVPEWLRAHEECGPVVQVNATGSAVEVEARVLDAVAGVVPEVRNGIGASA